MNVRLDVGVATKRRTYRFSNDRGELFLSEPFISPSTGETLIPWMVDSWPDEGIESVPFQTRPEAVSFIETLLGEQIPEEHK